MRDSKPIPSSRLARMSKLGGFASKVAGNVLAGGAKQLATGNRPKFGDLLLTPKNIDSLVTQLAHMRGAAMKLGQLLSMDAGEVLTPELAALLERLRSDADPMPYKQFVQVMNNAWGGDWQGRVQYISPRPFSAASIGQVHKANSHDGDTLAIKVQYLGVSRSIDSDVDNVMSLLRMARLLPAGIEESGLVDEAKAQLKMEADYRHEAEMAKQYAKLLDGDDRFAIPHIYDELTTETTLAMAFVNGQPIDSLASQAQRDQFATALIELFLRELLELQFMQTDPNPANYQVQADGTIVLLDFGATRKISDVVSHGYRKLLNAGYHNDRGEIAKAAEQIGYFNADIPTSYKEQVVELFVLATEALRSDGDFDFAASDQAKRIREQGIAISQAMRESKSGWHSPPVDALFIHRKVAGLYLIAAKLQAKVPVKEMFQRYLD
ncbi:ABC1 kinase family protein [Salinibius halmophilus]|uniref:ABC1 kinase family protein n=1 Tax=Salinibius halmophilus TaxID=1853216 RepID=UPI0018F341B3|nr:AarF/ABC1/UbiB kinase family protein [Salinibius halmophilus]